MKEVRKLQRWLKIWSLRTINPERKLAYDYVIDVIERNFLSFPCFEDGCSGFYQYKTVRHESDYKGKKIIVPDLRILECDLCKDQIYDVAACNQLTSACIDKGWKARKRNLRQPYIKKITSFTQASDHFNRFNKEIVCVLLDKAQICATLEEAKNFYGKKTNKAKKQAD